MTRKDVSLVYLSATLLTFNQMILIHVNRFSFHYILFLFSDSNFFVYILLFTLVFVAFSLFPHFTHPFPPYFSLFLLFLVSSCRRCPFSLSLFPRPVSLPVPSAFGYSNRDSYKLGVMTCGHSTP